MSVLFPFSTKTRTVYDLSGMWRAKFDFKNEGLNKNWGKRVPADEEIAVPASWNDQFTDREHRNFMGPVWYTRQFVVPAEWKGKLVRLRFSSATYRAKVWVNGVYLGEHEGGYSPFEFPVTDAVKFGEANTLVVYVDCILDAETIPQGNLPMGIGGYAGWHETNVPRVPFDFFPFGGIHRPVYLYASDFTYVDDITVRTDISGKDGIVRYEVAVVGNEAASVEVSAGGACEEQKPSSGKVIGTLVIKNCKFWSHREPNLYDLTIRVKDKAGALRDEYTLPIGVRTVKLQGTRFLLNGKPVYFKGFGRHEDFHVVGKGQILPVMVRDYNLMKWINANSFRTSHYPYSEEQLFMADRQGFLVCVESPSVTLSIRAATEKTLANHIRQNAEMYQRDKNHPSVVMWSLGDENEKGEPGSRPYFKKVVGEFRKLEKDRPISKALTLRPEDDKIADLFDFVIFNIYACWYGGAGQIETLETRLKAQVEGYWKKFKLPILIGEFGAECIPGLHTLPPKLYTEEYHCELVEKTIAWFRKQPYIIGEHIWVFADFDVAQSLSRIIYNHKGVFTRDRHPKMVAHLLKKIWDPANDPY